MNERARLSMVHRSAVLSHIRRYLEDDGFMEVETPLLHAVVGGARCVKQTRSVDASLPACLPASALHGT